MLISKHMSNMVPTREALMTTGTFPQVAIRNHIFRMDMVMQELRGALPLSGILDLGCGDGALIRHISKSNPDDIPLIGIDEWQERIKRARSFDYKGNVMFLEGSVLDIPNSLKNEEGIFELIHNIGAVVLLEVIEHIEPDNVQKVVDGVFGYLQPKTVVITTPDATSLKCSPSRMIEMGHKFEWTGEEFGEWASRVISNYDGYSSRISSVNGPEFVRPTQMATFTRN